jgi:hypothetical protein
MRLAELLAELPPDQLEALGVEHVRNDEPMSRAALCTTLEGILKSFRFVQDFLLDRQPPTFVVLTTLLDSSGNACPSEGFRERVMSETSHLCDLVSGGDILGRDDQLRLYRRVLAEARRNDLDIDPSESAILGVLRHELSISLVEHFLIEHHPDLQEFWRNDQCFLREINALRSAGLVFGRGSETLIAEDVAPVVSQALGIEMPTASARRLYVMLPNSDLGDALARASIKTSGSKDERIERLVTHRVQPRPLLNAMSLAALKDLCRDIDAPLGGGKDEIVERIVGHLAAGRDRRTAEVEAPIVVEERALDESRFLILFGALRLAETTTILKEFPGLRQSGTKDVRARTLWEAQRSEQTLLENLTSRDLEDILSRLALRTTGSKAERIDRIMSHFASVDPGSYAVPSPGDGTDTDGETTVVSDQQPASTAESETKN